MEGGSSQSKKRDSHRSEGRTGVGPHTNGRSTSVLVPSTPDQEGLRD